MAILHWSDYSLIVHRGTLSETLQGTLSEVLPRTLQGTLRQVHSEVLLGRLSETLQEHYYSYMSY
jgi:hypothetical protein